MQLMGEVPMEALILGFDRNWTAMAMQCVGRDPRFPQVEAYTNATLERICELATRPWGLVIMDAVVLAEQRYPLEGLVVWGDTILDVPLLVVSDYSSHERVEARDAMGLGATFYSPRPYRCSDLRPVIDQTLNLYQRRLGISNARLVGQVKRQDYVARFGQM